MKQKLANPFKTKDHPAYQATHNLTRKVLVIAHGDLATRQRPTYQHWLKRGVEVHGADVDPAKLEDCLDGIHRYVLPDEKQRLISIEECAK